MPVLFFAEMPAVIRPENDDGVVFIRSIFERVQNTAKHGIGEVDRSKVSLDALLPEAVFLDVREVAIRAALFAGGGKVIEIVFLIPGRKLDVGQGKLIEIFLRDKPGFVGAINSAGEKEGLFVFPCELFADPLGDGMIAAEFPIGDV